MPTSNDSPDSGNHGGHKSLKTRALSLYRALLALLAAVLLAVLAVVVLHQPGAEFAGSVMAGLIAACAVVLVAFVLIDLFDLSPLSQLKKQLAYLPVDVATYPEQVKSLSQDAVDHVLQAILEARCPPDIADLVTRHGLRPILRRSENADLFRRDLSYDIRFEYVTRSPWSTDVPGYAVETNLKSRRHPSPGPTWISFARTAEALRGEFAQDSCLARELVEIPVADWQSLVNSQGFEAGVRSGSRPDSATRNLDAVSPDVVRLHFPAYDAAAEQMVTVWQRFWLPDTVRFYPVRFARYFCVGATQIQFRIQDHRVAAADAFVSFAGDSALDPTREGIRCEADKDGRWHQMRVDTTGDVLLWPGSGVIFVWRLHEA
jgi:hypothetical protein